MADLSHLSDDEILKIVQGSSTAPKPSDLGHLSDDEILKAANLPVPKVIQEQHPSITFSDRFRANNFANPEAVPAYLMQQHPELEAKIINGQTVVRGPGEKDYKVMSPDYGSLYQNIMHIPQNPEYLSDKATGAIQSGLSGLAGAGAAVAALPETLGIGSMPAAMIAGGATNASLEALKEKIGQKYLDIPQEISPMNVAAAGVSGTLAPLIGGTGATEAQMAAKGLRQGLSSEAMKDLVASQGGAIQEAGNYISQKALPAVGEFMSGVPAKAIKTLANRTEDLMGLEKNGITDFSTAAYDKLRNGLASYKNQVGAKLGKLVKDLGPETTVDLSKTRGFLDSEIEKLSNSELANTPSVQSQIQELQDAKNQIFTEQVGIHPETGGPIYADMGTKASPQKAFELQSKLSEMGNYPKTNSKGLQSSVSGTPIEKQWQIAARNGYNEINNELSNLTEGQSSQLKGQYKKYIDLQKNLDKHFKSPEQTGKTLSSLDAPSKEYASNLLADVKNSTGVDLQPDADLLQAHKYFANPKKMPISAGGTTSTSRTLGLGGLGGALGYKIGGPVGAAQGFAAGNFLGSPYAVKNYTLGGQALANNIIEPVANNMSAPMFRQYIKNKTWQLMNQPQGDQNGQ